MAAVTDGEVVDETGLVLRRVVVGALETNCWIVHDGEHPECLVVDPGDDPERIRGATAGLEVKAMVITHGHWDHVLGAGTLAERWGLSPRMHEADRVLLARQEARVRDLATTPLADRSSFEIGARTVSVLHTPGHTPGSTCLRIGNHILSGDTLFPGGPGSTRGPLADFATIMRSVRERLFVLPDGVQVHPGHGHSTCIGDERPSVDEWERRGW